MRRSLFILAAGVLGAAVAYFCVYLMGTAAPRALMQSDQPELAWLRQEFSLSDAEFSRISKLHAGYLPQCAERCLQIERLNQSLRSKLAESTQITDNIEKLLAERAQLRVTCQIEMLKHFFEVSQSMPTEQGGRYMEWVIEHTCLHEEGMNHGLAGATLNATSIGHP